MCCASTKLLTLSVFLFVTAVACNLLLSLSSRYFTPESRAVKLISYCVDCPSPAEQGSLAHGLTSKYGVQDFSIVGELVYCVPNFAESPKLLNRHQFVNRIVMVDRGKNTLLDKVIKIQKGDASAIVIADDGRCTNDFRTCGPMSGSASDGGFAANDEVEKWQAISIPVIIVTVETADRMRSMMGIKSVNIPKWGVHNMTILRGEDGDEL